MSSNEKLQDESLLWVRFYGPELEAKSVPIYELGQTLVALQTIIHKVYWYTQAHPAKGRIGLPRDVRNRLALRVKERQVGSDLYGLIPFLSNPYVIGIITGVIGTAFFELGQYIYKQIKQNSRNAPMTSAIYNQVNIIVNRVDNTGGITKIELSIPGEPKPLVFDESVRQYVREIMSKPIYGETTQIEGQLSRLDVRFFTGFIQTHSGYVRLHLSPEDFDRIRYQSEGASWIRVEGRYLYFLGREGGRFDEFEVSKILDTWPE
jgi:hypothetical protein